MPTDSQNSTSEEQKDNLFVSYIYSKIPPWGRTALGALAGSIILGSFAFSIAATFGGTAIIGAVAAATVAGGVGGSFFPKLSLQSLSAGSIIGATIGGVIGATAGLGVGVVPGIAIGLSIGTTIDSTIKMYTNGRASTSIALSRLTRYVAAKVGLISPDGSLTHQQQTQQAKHNFIEDSQQIDTHLKSRGRSKEKTSSRKRKNHSAPPTLHSKDETPSAETTKEQVKNTLQKITSTPPPSKEPDLERKELKPKRSSTSQERRIKRTTERNR